MGMSEGMPKRVNLLSNLSVASHYVGPSQPFVWDVLNRDLAILAQTSYSKTLKTQLRLNLVTEKDIDAKFYNTASITEMKNWKLKEVYRERGSAEDLDYGGFAYSIF